MPSVNEARSNRFTIDLSGERPTPLHGVIIRPDDNVNSLIRGDDSYAVMKANREQLPSKTSSAEIFIDTDNKSDLDGFRFWLWNGERATREARVIAG